MKKLEMLLAVERFARRFFDSIMKWQEVERRGNERSQLPDVFQRLEVVFYAVEKIKNKRNCVNASRVYNMQPMMELFGVVFYEFFRSFEEF